MVALLNKDAICDVRYHFQNNVYYHVANVSCIVKLEIIYAITFKLKVQWLIFQEATQIF